MILTLTLPRIIGPMTSGEVFKLHCSEGRLLKPGTAFVDLKVDLSSAAAQDCPAVSYYRLVIREPVWLRHMAVACGDTALVGAAIALFSTEADETINEPPGRQIRFMTAGIVPEWAAESW